MKPKFLRKYEEVVEFSGIRIKPKLLLPLTFILFCIVFIFASIFDLTLSFLLSILVLDLGIGLPFFLADRKIDQIEARLPDVLHHIGTTLKTGGTIELALREVSRIDYGPITVGLKSVLRRINEGKTFEDAFNDFAFESRSELLKKAAVIIIAAKKAGGGLLDTLAAMAEDIRALYRLKRERKTKTFMQFLFILVAGCGVAPFTFGIVKSILEIMTAVAGTASVEALALIAQFDTLFKIYLIIASALTVSAAVQVREGKLGKSIIYIPFGVLAAYFIYTIVGASFIKIMGGA